MMHRSLPDPTFWLLTVIVLGIAGSPAARADDVDGLLTTIKTVGPEGQGHVEAARAVRELSRADARVLPRLLRAFDDAGPLAANWLRSAFEAIADRELRGGGVLPLEDLEAFVLDRERHPRARRMAFEWMAQAAPAEAARLVPGMLDDPSPEMRRDAVQQLIDRAAPLAGDDAGEEQKQAAVALYRQALEGAVDDDQVQAVVKPLRALGVDVDLQKHFGFVVDWRVIGPFDNRGGKGFAAVHPPEEEVDFAAEYEGQLGPVSWASLSTQDEYGLVDIAKEIENYKGSVMYAAAEFHSDRERSVELRLGTPNSWKVWVNGEFLFGHEEYHRGMELDQYRVEATLRPGRNVLLVKLCQNEQTEDWAQRYEFQLRVCDGTGSAVLPDPHRQAAAGQPSSQQPAERHP